MTAGNSSGMNDAAAAVLLMSEAEVKRRNIKPVARIVGYAQTGMDPKIMGMGPVTAISKLVSLSYAMHSNFISFVFLFVLAWHHWLDHRRS